MKSTSPSAGEDGEERAAGLILYRGRGRGREYLVLRHRDGGHWAFPKGRIEPGEDEVAAARREIAEETGLRIGGIVEGFRRSVSYRLVRGERVIEKTVTFFLAEAEAGEPKLSSEHLEFGWCGPERARRRLTHGESRQLLAEANRHLDRIEAADAVPRGADGGG